MNFADHTDDDIPTVGDFLCERGWRLVRIEKGKRGDIGVWRKGTLVLRTSEAQMWEWEHWPDKRPALRLVGGKS